MFTSIKQAVFVWAMDINRIIREEVVDLEPHEYCIGAVFIIAVGVVTLKR